ncbi:MAG: hypothetical protein WD397_04565 [Wenzhouxiangellaceae bacterium]
MSNRAPALDWIEPPGGGMRALRDRIERRNRRRFIAVGCAVAALVAGALIQDSLNVHDRSQPFDEIIARQAANEDDSRQQLRVIGGAALELPSPSSDARIYLVSTMQEKTAPESG